MGAHGGIWGTKKYITKQNKKPPKNQGGKKEKEVFSVGKDKGALHAEAGARSVAVLFMLLLSQMLIVPAVHHSQLPAWPKQ